MAYGDSILDAAIRTYQPVDAQGAIQGAQKIKMGDAQLEEAKNTLAQQKLDLEANTQLSPLETALKKAQAKNQLFSNALATATDSSSFDENMRRLADQGITEAEQYIGRYSPVLQQRLQTVYGGGQSQAGLGPDTAGLDQAQGAPGKGAGGPPAGGNLDAQWNGTTPEQRAAALQRLTAISQGLEQVKDPESWNTLRAQLTKAGMQGLDQIGDYSPIKAASIYSRLQPQLAYLQNRAIADQTGIPQPKVAPEIKVAGNSVFAIDPYSGTAKLIGQDKEFASVADGLGGHFIYDKTTGRVVGGSSSAPGTSPKDDMAVPKVDPDSGSLTAQTGLSQAAINSLIGAPNQPRGVAFANKINQEVTKWADKNGIDTSTFRSQASAYNDTLKQNIQRNTQGKILEGEILGSVDTLTGMLDAAKRGKVRYINQAQGWASQQTNDPQATQIADQINRFRNELAGYNAVAGGHLMQNGQPEPTPDDFRKADDVLSTGVNSGSVKALAASIQSSAEKNRKVLDDTINDTQKAMWDLFGVGKNFKPKSSSSSAAPPKHLSGVDQQAADWVKAHPDDPRAAAIKARLGI